MLIQYTCLQCCARIMQLTLKEEYWFRGIWGEMHEILHYMLFTIAQFPLAS